jgi:hypothetical protein
MCGLLVLATVGGWQFARACPLCGGGVQRTLGDEIREAEAVVIATLLADADSVTITEEGRVEIPQNVPKARFRIVEILKGSETVGDVQEIEVLYFGEEPKDTPFLVQAAKLDELVWGTPLPLDERSVAYVRRLQELPEQGYDRLAFFYAYLENPSPLLARDAYDEISRVPYAEIAALRELVDREQILAWITDPETSTSHRRLYLMLLGLVARDDPQPQELALLESAIRDEGDAPRTALDSSIACYLTLRGAAGLPLVEDRFLKNKDATYSDTYAAIMALRFHAEQEQVVPREQIVAALRHLLDRPDLADLIIADLARMEDWSVIDRLVELFKNADDKSSWVRVPVIQYLRACPLPEAEERLDELAQIDPEAVKRANFFVPLGRPNPVPPPSSDQPGQASGGSAAAGDAGAGAPASDKEEDEAKPNAGAGLLPPAGPTSRTPAVLFTAAATLVSLCVATLAVYLRRGMRQAQA